MRDNQKLWPTPHQSDSMAQHHTTSPRKQTDSTQKQIRVAFWFPLQRGHYQPLTWHSFLCTGGHEADFVHSFLSTMSMGLTNSDYQLFGSLKKYEMTAQQDQSQSDKLHNWLYNVLPHWNVYNYMTLADTRGSFSCRIIQHIITAAEHQLYGQMVGAEMCTNN
jgi:hypothetical protein